jgi:hypothetical protein
MDDFSFYDSWILYLTNGYIRDISVVQLSDRVYNVTFPAYDIVSQGIYIISRECHIIYPVW